MTSSRRFCSLLIGRRRCVCKRNQSTPSFGIRHFPRRLVVSLSFLCPLGVVDVVKALLGVDSTLFSRFRGSEWPAYDHTIHTNSGILRTSSPLEYKTNTHSFIICASTQYEPDRYRYNSKFWLVATDDIYVSCRFIAHF